MVKVDANQTAIVPAAAPVPTKTGSEWIEVNGAVGPVDSMAPWRRSQARPVLTSAVIPLQFGAPPHVDPEQLELDDVEDQDALDAATARSTEWPGAIGDTPDQGVAVSHEWVTLGAAHSPTSEGGR